MARKTRKEIAAEERARVCASIEDRIKELQRSLRHYEGQAMACRGALQELGALPNSLYDQEDT